MAVDGTIRIGTSIDPSGAQSGMKSLTDSVEQGAGKMGSSLSAIKGLVGGLITAATVKQTVGYITEVGQSFEATMSNVRALSGASNAEMKQLNDKAKALGASTKFSASEVGDAFSYMALAGWDTDQMLDGITGTLDLAASSGMDLASASDLVTDYLSAFGLEAKDSAKMVDELAYAQSHSNTNVEQLGEAFKNSAANMHAAGQDMETTTALLEAFANQGVKGSIAGTKLSAIVRDLGNKMEDGAISIGNNTVAVMDSEGNYRNLIDIIGDVEKPQRAWEPQRKQQHCKAYSPQIPLPDCR